MKRIVEIAGSIGGGTVEVDLASQTAAEEVEPGVYSILREGRSYEIVVREGVDGSLEVHVNGRQYSARVRDPRRAVRRHGLVLDGAQNVLAPMPGKVVRFLVKHGEEVRAGQGLVVVEAMKMQNEIKSPKAGKVVKIVAEEGVTVNSGQVLLTVE
jgi:biotin carboxyl carrier protein